MNKDLVTAFNEIEKESGIPRKEIVEAIKTALEKSYEKNYQQADNVEVKVSEDLGEIQVLQLKTVVEEVEDPIRQISLDAARVIRPKAQLGDEIGIAIDPEGLGRVAAQTARNVIMQHLKDSERKLIYDEYSGQVDTMITGTVQRVHHNNVYIDLGRTDAIVPPREQIPGERLAAGDRVRLYVERVSDNAKGPQIKLSRSNPKLVICLFEEEVPEIADGVVELMSIAREAGSRSKISVYSDDPNIDVIGACVGYKGSRVNAIVDELAGEKMDIILYNADPRIYIANALSPAQVSQVLLNEEEKSALVVVPDDQLSLAIGREGQNVRLAARLTGWKIDIKGQSDYGHSPSLFETIEQSGLLDKEEEEQEAGEETGNEEAGTLEEDVLERES